MSKEAFLKFFNFLQKKKLKLKDVPALIEQLFPNKKDKILESLARGTTKYEFLPSQRIIWEVKGNNKNYQILPRIYCSCSDFYKNVVIERIQDVCKHIIIQTISEKFDHFALVRLKDNEFSKLLNSL